MKKFLLSLVALMAFGASAWAEDGVTIPNARIAASRFAKLKVTVESTTPYRDLQFDLSLPEGITLKDATNGGTVVDEASNHVVKYYAEGSTIHFAVVDAIIDIDQDIDAETITAEQKANYGKTFTNGIVVEIPINAADDFQGTKTANLTNVNASFDNGTSAFETAGTSSFVIKSVILGDVNDDEHVDPTDALNIKLHYLDATPSDFIEEAGYITEGDEAIDPTDALEAMYIYLNSAGVKKMRNDKVNVEKEKVSELDPE